MNYVLHNTYVYRMGWKELFVVSCQEFPLLFVVKDHTTNDMKLIGFRKVFMSFHFMIIMRTMPQATIPLMSNENTWHHQKPTKTRENVYHTLRHFTEKNVYFFYNPLNLIMKRKKEKMLSTEKWGQTIELCNSAPSQIPTSFFRAALIVAGISWALKIIC